MTKIKCGISSRIIGCGRDGCVTMVLLFAWLLTGPAKGAEIISRIEIAAGGQSGYVIVVPDQADQGRIMQAATLLQANIQKSAKVTLPIIKESERQQGAPAFYLGKSLAARKAGLPLDKVQGWGYLNKTVGRDVFIVGDDAKDEINDGDLVIEHLGTLKGVTAFLETQLGVRFLLPGEYGVRVPEHDLLAVDATMDVFYKLHFDYVIRRAPRDKIFAVALNLFYRTPILKSYSGHSYYYTVPEKEYEKTHPEYFALLGGARTPKGNHLCISNPDVQALMLKAMEKELDKGYQWIELNQTDGYQACQCDKCAALHPDEGERLWIVHRKLAGEMKKRRPDKKIMIVSYGPTRAPPKTFTSFPDNVVIKMAYYTPEMYEQWAPYNVDKTVVIYNWGDFKLPGLGPTRTPRYVIDQLRRFLKNGVRAIDICGGYESTVGYGLNGPALYAFGKALENPDLEPKDVLDDYVNSLFGESAAPMRAFYRAMYDRLDAYSLFDNPNVPVGNLLNSMKLPEDFYCHCFPANLLNAMTINLARACAMAKDERVKAALKMVELEFNYVKNIASIFHVFRAYRVNPTPAAFDLLAQAMDERRRLLDTLFAADGACSQKLPGGLPLCFATLKRKGAEMNGRTMGLRPPFSWDFASLKAKGILPGSGKPKRLEVGKVTPFELDGDFDKAAWKDIPFQELSEIGMGKARNATRFKAAYDDQAIYLAVECAFDATEWLERLKSMGRDGGTWAQECIELVIDPYGERERHCQIAFSPITNSTFDARMGYITDQVHPLYGKRDVSWNGDWEYVARIDKEKKRWTAEAKIPFKTLEVDPPGPGSAWTLNVCRSEWPVEHGKGQPIVSAWSPNLESRDFHDRASFGEVVFK